MEGPAYWRAGTPGSILRGRWFDTVEPDPGRDTEFEISLCDRAPDRDPVGWKGYQASGADSATPANDHWEPLGTGPESPEDEPFLVDPETFDPVECLGLLEKNSYVFCDARRVGDFFLRALHTFPFRGWLQTSEDPPPYYEPDRQPWARPGEEPTLVMTHGYTGSPDNWTHLAEEFETSGSGYAVPLLTGHGLPPTDFAEFSDEDWIEALERELSWMKRFSHELIGIGLSMGGALNLVNWKKFEALVIINTPYFVPDWRRFFLPVFQWLKEYHEFEESDKTVPVKSMLYLRNVLTRGRSVLSEVTVPVLVINHRTDQTVSVNHGIRYKNDLPNADHLILEEGIHESPTEPGVAKTLYREIVSWLRGEGFDL